MADIFIHSFRFGENTRFVAEAPSCLSAEELARAERFKLESARRDFLISHYLLRRTLSRYLQTDARSISYRHGEHGKPYLDTPTQHDLHFNLSHSGDRLLVAVCRGCEIGVDIELMRQDSNPLQLARHFMSGAETRQLDRLTDPAVQRTFFYTLWTRKEAYIKALGKGFFHALDKTGMQEISSGVYLPNSEEHKNYRVIDLEIAEGYRAAVAVHMDGDSPSSAIGIKVFEE